MSKADDSLEYIRTAYCVPARFRGRIRFTDGRPREGTILRGTHHLRVKFDDGQFGWLHPTWQVEYLNDAGEVVWPPSGARGRCGGGEG